MICLSGFELYSRWVPLIYAKYQIMLLPILIVYMVQLIFFISVS